VRPAAAHADVYLRRSGSSESLAPGWETHPAGRVGDVRLDLVYRPDRHDVCRAIGSPGHSLRSNLAETGFRLSAVLDDGVEIWVRDRPTSVRARLAGFRVVDGGRARQR
jgi:hypothetical protein